MISLRFDGFHKLGLLLWCVLFLGVVTHGFAFCLVFAWPEWPGVYFLVEEIVCVAAHPISPIQSHSGSCQSQLCSLKTVGEITPHQTHREWVALIRGSSGSSPWTRDSRRSNLFCIDLVVSLVSLSVELIIGVPFSVFADALALGCPAPYSLVHV